MAEFMYRNRRRVPPGRGRNRQAGSLRTFADLPQILQPGTYFLCYPACGTSKRLVVKNPVSQDNVMKWWADDTCGFPTIELSKVKCEELIATMQTTQSGKYTIPRAVVASADLFKKYIPTGGLATDADAADSFTVNGWIPPAEPEPIVEVKPSWIKAATIGLGGLALVIGAVIIVRSRKGA